MSEDDTDSTAEPRREDRDFDVDLDEVVLDEGDDEESTGLFDDLLSGEPIFENKEVLRPSYTPHELPHRKEQINKMATILVAALRGETTVEHPHLREDWDGEDREREVRQSGTRVDESTLRRSL